MIVRNGEFSKSDSTQLKGIAILLMVLLHLFCRKTDLPYADVMVWNVPLSYFFGLFGDQCVAIYCFCSGYAHCLLCSAAADLRTYRRAALRRLLRFLIHFWIVVLVFCVVGLCAHSPEMPGSFSRLLGNLFLYHLSYNGAWWFVLTYCIITLLSAELFRIVRGRSGKKQGRLRSVWIVGVFFMLYAAGYIFRFKQFPDIENDVLHAVFAQLSLLFTSLFPYMIGMLFYEKKRITSVRGFVNAKAIPAHYLRAAVLAITIAMMVLHRIVEGMYVSMFIFVVTVLLFSVVPMTKTENRILLFFGNHSTNIWLTHMFFYLMPFRDFVFVARWPIPIFLLMLAVCIGVSYILKILQRGALKLLRL